jgi:hypothetical protein
VKAHYKMVDDCLVLLSYCSKHRGEYQSFPGLEDATGIPLMTLWHIVEDALENKTQSLLWGVARRHGYWFVVYPSKTGVSGPIIDVTYQGCLQCANE